METHQFYMRLALGEAQKAFSKNEVPVGAVLVKNDEVVAQTHNLRETLFNPLAHAELLAINEACQRLKAWRLNGVSLYSTVEPCYMCAGALVQARIETLVYGCRDPKTGGADSLYKIPQDPRLNHQLKIINGVLEKECQDLMQKFFKRLRQEKSELGDDRKSDW